MCLFITYRHKGSATDRAAEHDEYCALIRTSNETYCLVDVLAQAVLVSSWQLMRDAGVGKTS